MLSVIIPTAPIPSHPDARLIEFVIRCLRAYPELRNVEIIIAADGVHPVLQHRAEQYAGYKDNLKRLCETEWHNVRVMSFPQHIHQCNVVRYALETVTTPNVLFTGHGWMFHGKIDWTGIIDAMYEANSIRFYIFDDIHPSHQHLFKERVTVRGVPLMPTIQFADGPSVCRTEWIKDAIKKYVPAHYRCFNEDILWGIFHNKGWDGWEKMYVYAPERMNRNVWFNEREDDPTPPRIYGGNE